MAPYIKALNQQNEFTIVIDTMQKGSMFVEESKVISHYVRNFQRRCAVTKKGDTRRAHLRLIGDEHEGVSPICLLENKKISSRRH
jgi:hypothetical protein